ncbi:MAG TPA: hypothetical protein VFW22_08690 [Pseudolabrys sp.]|nr:hypothetical protein [Pseudolabrys sp.]
MEVVYFLLGLAHVAILFASALALAIFIVKRLAIWIFRLATAKPEAPKPAAPRQRLYTGPLTGAATVRLPQHFK